MAQANLKPEDLKNSNSPQNLEAEASLLGALLIDPEAIVKIADAITSEDFFDPKHRYIYDSMLQLYNDHNAIDVLTLSDKLANNGHLDSIGGPSYLTELTNFVPTASHVEQYADIVAQKALRRRLISTSKEITELSKDESKVLRELIEEAETKLFNVSQQHIKQNVVSLETILAESFDRLDDLHKDKQKIRGTTTGFKDLDNMLAGFQKSDLIILAARPSLGKTALALNFAHSIAGQTKEPVLIFSLEMSKEQLVDRLLSMESGVDAWALRTGNLTDSDFEKIGRAMGNLSEAPIYIDDTPGITVGDLRTKARREAHKHPLGLIIVDYLQLMSGTGRSANDGNRVQEISEISRGLKGIARELNVPLLALSQLSRSVESRSPQIPQLADLRESGCLTGDTLIYIANKGIYVPIRQLAENADKPVVSSVNDKSYKISDATVSKAFSTGFKQVYKLKMASGRTIKATANHKFLTIDGWIRLDELSTESFLATPRILTNQTTKTTMTKSQAALLGHLIGDGCTLPTHAIQYTTNDITLADTVLDLSNKIFGDSIKPRIQKERDWYQVYLPSSRQISRSLSNPVSSWLKTMGIFGLRSHEKYVPDQIFEQNNEIISTFIRHLWSTDGCIKVSSHGHPKIYYASSSKKLASSLHSLLLRLGITARLYRISQGTKGRDQYHVAISGYENLSLFSALVGAVGVDKIRHLKLVNDYLTDKTGNPNRDVIPKAVWHSHVVPSMQKIGITTRQMQSQIKSAYSGTSLYNANLSRERAERVALVVKSEELKALSQSDIYWDRIVAIERLGIEEVFDLTVPGPHNFVANDIIVHNSIEQDADVVAFIYREDYYNPETDRKRLTDILVKKHRNGPTGGIELYFDIERQRFKSVDTKHQEPKD